MTATADFRGSTASSVVPAARPGPASPDGGSSSGLGRPLRPADGVELLGEVHGTGYRDGVSLVRRPDGQMVQLGPLMYGLLDSADGRRDGPELAEALSRRLGRRVEEPHVDRLAEKLAAQGLLAGSEHRAPPRRNPLLALRWKFLVTDPDLTRRLTAPFAVLFRPWIMWPVLATFVAVFWFVLIDKGVASATSQAFNRPGLLLLVFALAVVSAGFHELGHAAACRYGGATPGGMGMGLYLVWPAFYTDVTDAYRLPRRARLRVDLAGLYFNAVVAVITMGVWLLVHADALLLLVALQILQMVKQLSPIIRADGYHILSDATGVPDLYAHLGPTVRRLLPGHRREPSALTGWARLLVTVWVLVLVPVMLSLTLGAVLLLPRLVTTAWDSGRHIATGLPAQAHHGHILGLLASLLQLLALAIPVVGSALVTQKVARTTAAKAWTWSRGRPGRRAAVLVAGAAAVGGLAWAWWPSGQYQPVRPSDRGTIPSMARLLGSPAAAVRPGTAYAPLAAGTHLAVAMIPVGGVSRAHPALFVVPGAHGQPATVVVSWSGGSQLLPATEFPFVLPAGPGPHGTQALAVNTRDGATVYQVAYSLITVRDGAPVDETNSAYALARCRHCTTVAVSFQVVLVVGHSDRVGPINAAGTLNYDCPACDTTAVADQLVVTLTSQPSKALTAELQADLQRLDAIRQLGSGASPATIASEVAAVQNQIQDQLARSGLVSGTPSSSVHATTGSTTTVPPPAGASPTTTPGAATGDATTGTAPPASGSSYTYPGSAGGAAAPGSTATTVPAGQSTPSTTTAPVSTTAPSAATTGSGTGATASTTTTTTTTGTGGS